MDATVWGSVKHRVRAISHAPRHMPSTHDCPSEHLIPHPPQFLASREMSATPPSLPEDMAPQHIPWSSSVSDAGNGTRCPSQPASAQSIFPSQLLSSPSWQDALSPSAASGWIFLLRSLQSVPPHSATSDRRAPSPSRSHRVRIAGPVLVVATGLAVPGWGDGAADNSDVSIDVMASTVRSNPLTSNRRCLVIDASQQSSTRSQLGARVPPMRRQGNKKLAPRRARTPATRRPTEEPTYGNARRDSSPPQRG